MNDYRTCITCNQTLCDTEFYVDKSKKSGFASECIVCKKQRSKLWRSNNKQAHRDYSRNWIKEHPEQARTTSKLWAARNKDKVQASRDKWNEANKEIIRLKTLNRRARLKKAKTYLVTDKDIKKMLRQPCNYCGAKATQIDHVLPLVKGGTHSVGNLAPACASCNGSKAGKFLSVWRYSKN